MSEYFVLGNAGITRIPVEDAFPFLKERGHIISLIGGGGKTTIMYELADFCASEGMKSLVLTTTHICKPDDGSFAETQKQVETLWSQGVVAVIGSVEGEKLTMPEKKLLQSAMERADIVFIEADGAKHRPCKVPIEKEPVLLSECDIVLGIAGLDALEKPIEEACFRVEKTEKFLGKTRNESLVLEDLTKILTSPEGTKKDVGNREYYVLLNKYDSVKENLGCDMLKYLYEYGQKKAVLRGREN